MSFTLKEDWQDEAACLGNDSMTLWGYTEQAKAICAECPVLDQCLLWVRLEEPVVPGVLAGLSAQQRGLRECRFCGIVMGRKQRTARVDVCQPCYDVEIRPFQDKPPTMHDVAREAGCSWSTVRNVFSGATVVSDEMRERVLAAAERVGYRTRVPA